MGNTPCVLTDRVNKVELLRLDYFGKTLLLEGSMAGWQQLSIDDTVVSQLAASGNAQAQQTHEFELPIAPPTPSANALPQILRCRLQNTTQWQPFAFEFQFFVDDKLVADGKRNTKDIEQQVPLHKTPPQGKTFSLLGLAALGMKLLKSAKVIKVALAGASLGAYSYLFSFKFALALIACLVIHEYGHIRAMKYFGMKTKGIYLIPFLGGAAVTEDKINTRWQNVVISMMGPCFGLLMSLACIVAYALSGAPFFAALATFNAFLNLLNLLPILPLDGGHVLKSISFSMNNTFGLVVCILAAIIGIALSFSLGFSLFGIFMIIGCIEIFMEWRIRHNSHLLPLDRYGQVFSAVWYSLLVTSLIGIIWYFGSTGDDIMRLPLKVLQS
jgi:Zn-dependent protease